MISVLTTENKQNQENTDPYYVLLELKDFLYTDHMHLQSQTQNHRHFENRPHRGEDRVSVNMCVSMRAKDHLNIENTQMAASEKTVYMEKLQVYNIVCDFVSDFQGK